VFDMVAALICHGVFDRHPRLNVVSLELGAGWVPYLQRRLRIAYGKSPQLFGADPIEAFHEHVWVAPFYEDDISAVRDAMSADRVLLGSDWPHPEGLAEPRSWLSEFGPFTVEERRKVFRDNLRLLSGR